MLRKIYREGGDHSNLGRKQLRHAKRVEVKVLSSNKEIVCSMPLCAPYAK